MALSAQNLEGTMHSYAFYKYSIYVKKYNKAAVLHQYTPHEPRLGQNQREKKTCSRLDALAVCKTWEICNIFPSDFCIFIWKFLS